MGFTKRDWLFVAIALAIMAILMVNGGRKKPRRVPSDERHLTLLDAVKRGENGEEAEKACATCHSDRTIPLPKGHPPKEQCLLCHDWKE